MTLLRILLLIVFVHFVVSEITSGVQQLSNEDISKYQQFVSSKRNSNKLFASVEDTHNAVAALFKFNIKPDNTDALCANIKSDLSSSDVKKIQLAHTTALRLGCTVPSDSYAAADSAIKNTINDANADFDSLYNAVRALLFLRKNVNSAKDTELLNKAFDKVLSQYNKNTGAFCSGAVTNDCLKKTGQAYEAIGMLVSLMSVVGDVRGDVIEKSISVSKLAPTIIKQALGANSVNEASALVRGINRLADVAPLDKKSLKRDIEEIAEFLLNKKHSGVSTLADLYDLVEGLATIARSSLYTPYVVSELTTSNNVFSIGVANVLGKLPAGSKLTLKKVSPINNENQAIISNGAFTADGKDNTKFSYDYSNVKDKIKSGVFKLTIEITPGENKDGLSSESFVRIANFASGITVTGAKLAVLQSKDKSVERSFSLNYPATLTESIDASSANTLRLTFSLVDATTNKAARAPQQVFVRLFNNANNVEEYFFIAKPSDDDDGSYSVDLVVSKLAGILAADSEGSYSLQLLVGDAAISTPIQWNIAKSISLNSVPKKTVSDDDESLLQQPRQVINHVFRKPDTRASKAKSTLFTGLVLAVPLIALFIGITSVGLRVHIPDAVTFVNTLVLQGCILAMLGVIVLYWLQITIFQAFAYLSLLGLLALFFGSKALTGINASQNAAKPKQD